jgi:tetratricopeptide (TPR) repeat protein
MAYSGDRDGALSLFDKNGRWLPNSGQSNTMGSWTMLALVVEGLVMIGEKPEAGRLYPLVQELAETGAVALWPIFRFTETVAGIAAGAAGRWEAAENHFETALQQAKSIPHGLERAEIRRFQAMMLIDRADPDDCRKARRLLEEALDTYTQIGMPRHIEMTRTLLG